MHTSLNARGNLLQDGDRSVELFTSIKNLLDQDPPANLRFNGNPVYFDPVGRNYRVGIRAEW